MYKAGLINLQKSRFGFRAAFASLYKLYASNTKQKRK